MTNRARAIGEEFAETETQTAALNAALDADQECRDCGQSFPYNPDADRCPKCAAAAIGASASASLNALQQGSVPRDITD